ncbi:MAG: DUF2249 domain-containing protein [Deltaproteobacteria bacterium]|nr:DUF2249 domain-containing protein [Deltaproteobacteria bacterium]
MAERNTLVTRRFEAAAPGQVFEVVVDCPPWVLYHQLLTERLGEFDWEVLESGPALYRVRITKHAPQLGGPHLA